MKKKVLVVEDDISIGEKIFIETKNIDCVTGVKLATSIKEAMNCLDNKFYEIIVLDLNLPDGNGIQLLRWLKEKQIQTKVLVFSINKELKKLCLHNGATSFYDKSRDFEELLADIKDCETAFELAQN